MKHLTLTMLCALLLQACTTRQPQQPASAIRPIADASDSTIYGLVCDGSNDTIIVFLNDPYDGSDPDTLDILEASKAQQVFGSLRIGDRVAIMRDTADNRRASRVIVTQDLLGQWCYKVKPSLRRVAGMEGQSNETAVSQLPDSLQQLLDTEMEYSLVLKTDSMAYSIGMRLAAATADEQSPIEYPATKRYAQWYIRDGRLLLTESAIDSLGNSRPVSTDTTELVMLTPDTLVLRFADGERGYYRKTKPTP